MKQKYVKPIYRDLGEVLQNAVGDCQPFGSIAKGPFGADCGTGGNANGYACQKGNSPGSSCLVGLQPEDGGCRTGNSPLWT